MLTYLTVNLLSVSVPFIFTFHKRLTFYKTWYAFWPACLATASLFILWDIIFTSQGVWGFNDRYLLGITWLSLPLEEWLFFICIPYACMFTYACFQKLIHQDWIGPYAKLFTWLLFTVLVIVALLNTDRLYTSVTFFSTAIFLLIHLVFLQSEYLGRFYLTYLVIFLFPFLIVNGILTGSFIDEPVVWYNNSENLSLRFITIPVEDFIYGLLLFLMNVTIYEMILSHRLARENNE